MISNPSHLEPFLPFITICTIKLVPPFQVSAVVPTACSFTDYWGTAGSHSPTTKSNQTIDINIPDAFFLQCCKSKRHSCLEKSHLLGSSHTFAERIHWWSSCSGCLWSTQGAHLDNALCFSLCTVHQGAAPCQGTEGHRGHQHSARCSRCTARCSWTLSPHSGAASSLLGFGTVLGCTWKCLCGPWWPYQSPPPLPCQHQEGEKGFWWFLALVWAWRKDLLEELGLDVLPMLRWASDHWTDCSSWFSWHSAFQSTSSVSHVWEYGQIEQLPRWRNG